MEKFKILIVEDNSSFRQLLRKLLQSSFPAIAIEMAADGSESLQKIDASPPDLIFMDIRLPGENGLQLTKKIKTTHPNVIIFIMTFYNTPEYREAALQCGADRFFAKTSLDRGELEDLIKSYLNV